MDPLVLAAAAKEGKKEERQRKRERERERERKEIAGGEARDINSSRRTPFLHAGDSRSFRRYV